MINVFLSKLDTVSKKPLNPAMEWQTGDYRRTTELRFTLPYQFLLLCKLMDITPHEILLDFMDNLSCGSWKREGRDKAKIKLVEYFLEHGYGREYYSSDEIELIFRELDAIGMLYPKNANQELINEHTRWRENYHTWWFEKWFNKNKRET